MSTYRKLNKAQLSKIIQSGRFFGNMIDKLGKDALMKIDVPLAKDILPQLATKATSSIKYSFERKMRWCGAVRAGKGFTLFISNEDMDDVIRIIQSLEKSRVLIDGITETVKLKKREQET